MNRQVDLNAASKYLSTLAPNVTEFTFQTFADKKTGKRDPMAAVLVGSLEDLSSKLQSMNDAGAGIFVTINATRGKTRRSDAFVHARAIWADMDGVKTPKWPIEPTMVVESSRGKFHFYFVLRKLDMPLESWKACMARIVAEYGADKAATDPVRVLRLPGFYHCKGKPTQVRLVKCGGKRYSTAQLLKAFPPLRAVHKTATPRPAREDIDIGALRSALIYLAKQPISKRPNCGTYVDDYETWIRFGLALKRDVGDAGFAIWDEWSRSSKCRYPGREIVRDKWDNDLTVAAEHGAEKVHIGSIFFTAQRNGWSFSKYEIAKKLKELREGLAGVRISE